MRSISKLLILLALVGTSLWMGCTTAIPTSYIPTSGVSPAMVVNFEGGTPLAVNSTLAEANRPGSQVVIPGTVGLTLPSSGYGTGGASTAAPGANGTSTCYYVYGTVIDKMDASYPSIQLQIPLEKSSTYSAYYDAELFHGVQFYYKVTGSDNAKNRVFTIPVAQTQPPSAGGTCNPSASPNACYNNFSYTYPSTNGVWSVATLKFTDLARGAYGAAITPSSFTGANLQQILMLQWGEGNQNLGGTAIVDFYVDEVQFFY